MSEDCDEIEIETLSAPVREDDVEMKEDDVGICTICQVSLNDKSSPGYCAIRRFPCGHQFHYGCIDNNIVSCPNCRGDVNILCQRCHKPLKQVVVLEGEQKRLCRGCLIDFVMERWTKHRFWISNITRNIHTFQYVVYNTLSNLDNGILEEGETLTMIKAELSSFFAAMDMMIRSNLK